MLTDSCLHAPLPLPSVAQYALIRSLTYAIESVVAEILTDVWYRNIEARYCVFFGFFGDKNIGLVID